MLRKYMSLIGVGSAQIDLILEKETYKLSEPVYGFYFIKGGKIEQQIKRIECDLVMKNHTLGIDRVIDTATILSSSRIESKETNKMSFNFHLPETLQISSAEVSYRFKTRLTFNEGVVSRDEDRIEIIK